MFFTLKGRWNRADGTVEFEKIYDAELVPASLGLKVEYKGTLGADDEGQPILTGTWLNSLEGTFGAFAARLEEP